MAQVYTYVYGEEDIKAVFEDVVWSAIGSDAGKKVSELLAHDVIEDVKSSSSFPQTLKMDDVRLAFGRVLCEWLGLDGDHERQLCDSFRGQHLSRECIAEIRSHLNVIEHVLDEEDKVKNALTNQKSN